MQRNEFLKKTFLSTAVLATSSSAFTSCIRSESEKNNRTDDTLEKVRRAMLSMQRASWEQGVAAQAFLESGDDEMVVLIAKEALLRQAEDGRLSVLYSDNGVTDPAASGEAVLVAAALTGDQKLKQAADKMLDYLLKEAPRTKNGIISHTLNSREVWIDSMYMSPPFLTVAGKDQEAINQIEGMRKVLWNKAKRLYVHRWSETENKFLNDKCWGVGNGWALAGICRVINALPDIRKDDKKRFIQYTITCLDSCISHMRGDGLFHNIIDDPNTFIETNLSQMIAYTIYKGVKSGWLSKKYLENAHMMRDAAKAKIDEYGYVQGVCGAPYFNKPGRATEGQAFYILMEAARKEILK